MGAILGTVSAVPVPVNETQHTLGAVSLHGDCSQYACKHGAGSSHHDDPARLTTYCAGTPGLVELKLGLPQSQRELFEEHTDFYGSARATPRAVTGGIRPYAPRQAQYDTWYEGIPRGK
jgi:hypothetical protein